MKIKKAAFLTAAIMLISGCSDGGKAAGTQVNANTAGTQAAVSGEDTAPAEEEKAPISCKKVAERVMSQDYETVPTMEVTDETMISDVLGYDMSLADDYSIYMQMISAQLFELTVIRAADGQRDAVIDMLEERRKYLKEQAAVYPAQVEAADAAIVSNVGDYCYLICDPKANDLERYMVMAIKTPTAS